MRIAYFGYDFFWKCLSRVLQDGHDVVRVFSFPTDNEKYNFNEKILSLAKDAGIPSQLERVREGDLLELKELGCDLLLVAGYQYRIPTPENAIPGINVHPTLLPHGKGAWPLPHVILKNLSESGVSIHRLEHDFDAGPILLQEKFRISPMETLESLSFKCHLSAERLLSQLLPNFEAIWSAASPQSGGGSYWPLPSEEEQTINWNESVFDIDRVIRAYGKLHSTAILDGVSWLVADATVWQEPHNVVPGTVVLCSNREMLVAASDGFVCLRHFEKESNKC